MFCKGISSTGLMDATKLTKTCLACLSLFTVFSSHIRRKQRTKMIKVNAELLELKYYFQHPFFSNTFSQFYFLSLADIHKVQTQKYIENNGYDTNDC